MIQFGQILVFVYEYILNTQQQTNILKKTDTITKGEILA